MNRFVLTFCFLVYFGPLLGRSAGRDKPRILISTDIGGSDPDDNQSMIHFLMYSNLFRTEGLVSSPADGHGTKQNILDMIALYEKDLPKLRRHGKDFPSPDALRAICKQGSQRSAPFSGYTKATEGSNWIVKCARKKSSEPLWVLVWGGLDDLAQALHDAPDIRSKIKVYWIGGPNKKWSVNSYAYIVKNFPDLWFIEVNSSYRGFFSDNGIPVDSLTTTNYYDRYIRAAGYLGKDFKNYYDGNVKMGDTPSLLYMMSGDPYNPLSGGWGGRFRKIDRSSRTIFYQNTTLADTVAVYSVVAFHIKGPDVNIPRDSACLTLMVAGQKWEGFYLGNGEYAVRYCPKQAETLSYVISSSIPGFPEGSGRFVVANLWPGKPTAMDYKVGPEWYTDLPDPGLYDGIWQGARTVGRWRNEVLLDWAKRWAWLR